MPVQPSTTRTVTTLAITAAALWLTAVTLLATTLQNVTLRPIAVFIAVIAATLTVVTTILWCGQRISRQAAVGRAALIHVGAPIDEDTYQLPRRVTPAGGLPDGMAAQIYKLGRRSAELDLKRRGKA